MSRPCCKPWFLAIVLLIGIPFTLGGCASLSVDQEKSISEDFERDIKRSAVIFRDRVVVDYVDRIGREILAATAPQPFEYEFQVIENDAINAFAGPAGKIFIHTGVILRAKNVAELAGVIAHEIGHVVHRHVADNYGRAKPVSIGKTAAVVAAGVLGGGNAARGTDLLGGLAAASYLNKFTREAENEADAFAVDAMIRAGYDPASMVNFFRTLAEEGGPRPPEFLSSHPTTESRIQATSDLVRSRNPGESLRRTDGGRFEIIQRRIELRTGKASPGGSEPSTDPPIPGGSEPSTDPPIPGGSEPSTQPPVPGVPQPVH